MAVVQISRIQIRRGKINSGTGLPQLASGELAWAVDTQELYIGNGAVSEGSPAVGNTKILTLNDLTTQGNVLSLLSYIYKSDDTSIVTGSDQNNPTTRILQYKMDDFANVKDFGVVGDGLQDDTVAFQRAIDQLFLNGSGKASDDTFSGSKTRVTLMLPAGTFKITSTLYIPSYATIVGSGADKSIIDYDPTTPGTGPAIQFINDSSTIGNPSDIISTLYNTQPRNISIAGLTVRTLSGEDVAMQLDCVRDSTFTDITLRGGWTGTYTASSVGLQMNALEAGVTTENNDFKNLKVYQFNHAVYAKQDIKNNHFNGGYIEECYQGFVLGDNANGTTPGEQYGPRETLISEFKFVNVKRHAVYLELGSKNTTRACTYTNVGNDGSGNTGAIYPQVYYAVIGNSSVGDKSDRHDDLATNNLFTLYVPEFAGHGVYSPDTHNEINIGYIIAASPILTFRLACNTNGNGVPTGSITYNIQYQYKSTTHEFTRRGIMTVAANIDSGSIQLSDEFDFAGPNTVSPTEQILLDFQAVFLDESNAIYTGAPGQIPASIGIYYKNDYSADAGRLYYTYSAVL